MVVRPSVKIVSVVFVGFAVVIAVAFAIQIMFVWFFGWLESNLHLASPSPSGQIPPFPHLPVIPSIGPTPTATLPPGWLRFTPGPVASPSG